MDISVPIEFAVRWRGQYLRPSKHAMREMMALGVDLHDIRLILETGCDRPGKRAESIVERCVLDKKKLITVVAVESYAHDINEPVWLIIHVGGK